MHRCNQSGCSNSKKNEKMKIAIVGLGKFGSILFKKLNKYNQVEYICGRSINDRLLKVKENYGVEISDNYEKILDKVDFIVISTPTNSHYSIAKNCLLRGKNVFVEKPPCSDLKEVQELFNLAKEKKLKIYVDDVFLYRKEYSELKNLVIGHKINKIQFTWTKYGTFDDSILNALTYHDMYLLIDLLGKNNLKNLEVINIEDPLKKNRTDILEFKFKYNNVLIEYFYDRTNNKKEKILKIIANGKLFEWRNRQILINNQPHYFEIENDALSLMFLNILEEKASYSKNNFLALNSVKLIKEIENAINSQKSHLLS